VTGKSFLRFATGFAVVLILSLDATTPASAGEKTIKYQPQGEQIVL
jgi:hypothetical protein